MLREKFLPGRAFVFFIVTLISIAFFLAIIVSISDYIIGSIIYHSISGFPKNPLTTLAYYFLLILFGIFIYFIFFLLFLVEFFYRNYNLSFYVFLFMSVLVSIFCAWLAWTGHASSTYPLAVKNTICLIIAGIGYPFVSNFWAKKIKFIKLVPVDEEL